MLQVGFKIFIPKMNIQKPLTWVYIYIHNNQLKNLIHEIIPFAVGTKTAKYSGILLRTDVQGLYTENHQALLNSIKKPLKMMRYTMFMDGETKLDKDVSFWILLYIFSIYTVSIKTLIKIAYIS